MEYNQTVQLTKFSGLSKINIKKIYKTIENYTYNENDGFGYKNVSSNSKYIHATLIKSMPTFIWQLNTNTYDIFEQEIILVNEVEFGLDFKFDFLDVYGSNKNISKVISAVSPLMNSSVNIDAVNIVPATAVAKLNSSFKTKIERLVVNNFQYKDGISGKYDMRIDNTKIALQVLKNYKADISKVSLIVDVPNIGEVKLVISSNGSLSIKSNETDFFDVLDTIKSNLFQRME
ncbi:MAG: hypothetical protein JNK81_06945 [Anaerolineales bacterium]|nr:hypothetical protein [Anaerolineales bacterium]